MKADIEKLIHQFDFNLVEYGKLREENKQAGNLDTEAYFIGRMIQTNVCIRELQVLLLKCKEKIEV